MFEKPAFPSLDLGEWLSGRDYGAVELCGLVSYICVLSNAVVVKAALPEAEVSVDARCTGGPDPALHKKALDLKELTLTSMMPTMVIMAVIMVQSTKTMVMELLPNPLNLKV